MFGTQNLWVFLVSAVALNITPGQDTFFILGRSVSQGSRAGLVAAAGILAGCVVQAFAVAFGLSALIASSPGTLMAVKLAGAGYLIYLGARMLFARQGADEGMPHDDAAGDRWGIFRSGVLCNLLNPKAVLFYLAFLPQFVAPDAVNHTLALLFLGGLFLCTSTCWCLTVVAGASAISRRFRGNASTGIWLQRGVGLFFVGLGVRLALNS